MRARRERCEVCGRRRVKHGRICRGCKARVQRELDEARGLVNRSLIVYAGTVGRFRRHVLPELRRAGVRGETLCRDGGWIQGRLNRFMRTRGPDAAA
jgi:hypothetical protein